MAVSLRLGADTIRIPVGGASVGPLHAEMAAIAATATQIVAGRMQRRESVMPIRQVDAGGRRRPRQILDDQPTQG
jgi:hypothetical protein